jgi:hypothetical protein
MNSERGYRSRSFHDSSRYWRESREYKEVEETAMADGLWEGIEVVK